MMPVEVLLKAADIIEAQDHLAKGTYEDEFGCVCVYGALLVAVGKRATDDRFRPMSTETVAADIMERHLGLGASRLHEWNDNPRRGKKSVAKALRAAAKWELS